MTLRPPILIAIITLPLLSGCVSTAASIITAPVRATGKIVDWTTTSQSESDENRGRALRKRDEELGKRNKQYQKHVRACQNGSHKDCDLAGKEAAAIEELRSRAI